MEEDRLVTEEITQASRKLTFWPGVAVALWLLVAQVIVALPTMIGAFVLSGKDQVNASLGHAIGMVLIFSFPLAVWLVLRKWKLPPNAFAINGPWVVPLITALLMTFSMSYLIGDLLTYLPGYDDMLSDYSEIFGQIKPIYLLIGGAFIGPICEEIIFRGVILRKFLKSYDPYKAIFLSALIFGVIHGVAIQVIYAFVLGLLLGWIFYRTKSLWLCTFLHVLNNFIAFSSDSDDTSGMRESIGDDALYFGSIALSVVTLVLALYFFNKSTKTSPHDEALALVDEVSSNNS